MLHRKKVRCCDKGFQCRRHIHIKFVGGHSIVLNPDPTLRITTIAQSCAMKIGSGFRTRTCLIFPKLVHCCEWPSGKMAALGVNLLVRIIMCDCTHRITVNQELLMS